jgi:hypothetical protein
VHENWGAQFSQGMVMFCNWLEQAGKPKLELELELEPKL